MFADRATAPVGTRAALALALLTVEGRRFEQAYIDEYPSDETAVNVDYGDLLATSGLFRDGTHHPINLLVKLAVGSVAARRALFSALVQSRGALETSYASAAGHVVRTVPPEAALTTLAQLPDPIRLATVSDIDWCGRRPDALLNYRATLRLETPSSASASGASLPSASDASSPNASIALVQRGISQAVNRCPRKIAATNRRRR